VDLILLDLVMPRMNGVHFCRAVQQKNLVPDAKIIILSSAEQEVAERVMKVTRAVGFLPKPVRERELREAVHTYLPLAGEQEEEEEFDLGFEMQEDLSLDDDTGQPERTSDDALSSQGDLKSIMRDKLDSAVATALASKLDEIVEAESRGQILDLIAEVLAMAIDEKLVDRFIQMARATLDQPEENEP
jgi:DNA-binding response OmpR family regulator